MKFFSRSASSPDLSIRGSLLRRTLRQYCSSNRQTIFTETVSLEDTETPVALLESLSAFPKPKNAAMAVFDGLVNAPEAHLGRNVLVCAQPLQTELAAFAARNDVDITSSAMWWKNVLRNFERVIFLDRHSLAQSVGFSPWARLSLADHFPVFLDGSPNQSINAHVLILNHHPATGAKEILEIHDRLSGRCAISVLTINDPHLAYLDAIPTATIHIHYGYDNNTSPVGLTPFDSLANGVYTVVLPALVKAGGPVRQEVDTSVVKETRTRSYALLADDIDEAVIFVERTLNRLSRFAEEKFAINPELQRFDRMNEEYITTMLARFIKQVPV